MKTDIEQHFYDQVWAFWTPKGAERPACIRILKCGNAAVTLHEINPKSTNPEWLDQPFNSIPICAECHDKVQLAPTAAAIELHALATERAQDVRDWKGPNYSGVVREFYDGNNKAGTKDK